MKTALMALLAAVLLVSSFGCNNGKDRNDDTGRSEKQDRTDVTRGRPPGT
jgi:hypothetical protein